MKALEEYLRSKEPLTTKEPLFPLRKGGTPITRQQAYRILNEAATTVDIKDQIGIH